MSHRLKRNENKSTNDWAAPAPYAGVRVIIRTPMYFFLAAVLPGDGPRHTTQTQFVTRSPQRCKLLAFMSVCRPRGGNKKSFGCFFFFYPPSTSSELQVLPQIRRWVSQFRCHVNLQCTLCIWGVV